MARVHRLEDREIFTISIGDFEITLKYENKIFRKMVEEVSEELIDGEVVTATYYRATDETFTMDEVNKMIKDAYKNCTFVIKGGKE